MFVHKQTLCFSSEERLWTFTQNQNQLLLDSTRSAERLRPSSGFRPPTCVQEGVGVTADDDVEAADPLGDLLVHREARVTQSDDLVDPQRQQLVHVGLQG